MQVSLHVTTIISQFASFFKYRQILSIWDGLVYLYHQRFDDELRRPKLTIWALTIIAICQLSIMGTSAFYFILKSDPDPTYRKWAEPWTGSVKEARVAFLTATISLFPSYITWICAGHLFVVSSYYLRWGFKDLQGRMTHETQLLNQLALYKENTCFCHKWPENWMTFCGDTSEPAWSCAHSICVLWSLLYVTVTAPW